MKLLQEYLDKEISFSKQKAKTTTPTKQSVYTSLQISKLNLKS